MKKFYLFAATTMALLTACQENEALVTITDAEINSAESVELSASINESSTRTYLGEGGGVCWELKEAIGVFYLNSAQSKFTVRAITNDAKTNASLFCASPNKSGEAIAHAVAVYPYDANATLTLNYDDVDVDVDDDDNVDAQDGDNVDEQEPTLASYTVATTFPAVQSYKANSFGSGASPMMAIAEKGSDLGFKNVAATIKLQLTGTATISKVEVTTTSGKPLAGACTYTMGIDGSAPVIEFAEDAATTITLNCGEGVQLSAEEATSFMFTLPPMSFEANELIFTIYNTDVYYMVQNKQDAFTAARSTISRVGQEGYTYKINGADGYQAVEGASGVLVNEAGDEYLILDADGLAWLEANHAEATYTLAFDIDLGGAPAVEPTNAPNALRSATRSGATGWTPIGTAENPFKGTFNGNGKTIKGLFGTAGLFGYVEGGTIKNVTLTEAIIEAATNYIGIVVGYLNGGTVENVSVKASQITSIREDLEGLGAIIGYIAGSININDCEVKDVTINENNTEELYGDAANDATIILDGYTPISSGLAYNEEKKTYAVSNAEGLVTMTTPAYKLKGREKIVLTADIDLTDVDFAGLGAFNAETTNTFDGQNHTVSNWTYTGGAADMAFFKEWVGTIQNVTFDNCHLTTNGRSAIVATKPYGDIKNVHVNNCSIEDGYWACGLIAGLYNAGNISDCSATNSKVTSNGGTGAIIGVLNETAGTRSFTNCKVVGCTINNTGVYGEPYAGAAIVGLINISNSTVEFIGCEQKDNTFEGGHNHNRFYGYADANDNINIIIK